MTDSELSASEIAQRQQASRTHGAYSLERRGESSLEPGGLTRLQELKQQFMSEPGRVEYRRDLAAFLALIVELGGSDIRKIAESGGNIWQSSPISRMGTYLNSLIRLLDNWPNDHQPLNLSEHIMSNIGESKDEPS